MGRFIPRVLALNGYTGFGRGALSAIIPVMSAMGVQVCGVPTAIVSSPFEGFDNVSVLKTTDAMYGALGQYAALGLKFEGIYSGFLACEEQFGALEAFIKTFGKGDCFVTIDPVFADNGRLCATASEDYIKQMRRMIKNADFITPNLTEAAYLAGDAPREDCGAARIAQYLQTLRAMGAKRAAITGIPLAKDALGISAISEDGSIFTLRSAKPSENYSGAGDIFAAAATAAFVLKKGCEEAVGAGADFLESCVALARDARLPGREGLPVEAALDALWEDARGV